MNNEETQAELAAMVASSEALVAGLFAAYERDMDAVDDYGLNAGEAISDVPYAVTLERHVDILLAGGGPTHRLDVTLDSDGDVTSVVSLATWAGPTISTPIYEGSALWRLAEWHTDSFGPVSAR